MKRYCLSVVMLAVVVSTASAQSSLGFLKANLGKRVGGGECAHMVSEALRVSGAEFVKDLGADTPNSGDYVWGTLVKIIQFQNGKWTDSNPSAKVQPGDVIQYHNAALSNGLTAHHTSMVAAVDQKGMPVQVYEQNVGNAQGTSERWVHLDPLDLTKLSGGFVRIYRPKTRADQPGQYKYSIVNNATSDQQVQLFSGQTPIGGPNSITSANTTNSYSAGWVSVSGNSQPILRLSNGASIPIDNAAGYEIFQAPGGAVSIRKLPTVASNRLHATTPRRAKTMQKPRLLPRPDVRLPK